MKKLGAVLVMLMVCSLGVSDGLSDKLFDKDRWEVSGVEALDRNGTGGCVSYQVANVGNSGVWVDGGGLTYDEVVDPFIGASTNIPPIDKWTTEQVNISTRWGTGYLFRAKDIFTYVRAKINW